MKLIGMMLALLIIAVLVITQMKQFGGGGEDPTSTSKSSSPMADRFRDRCLEVSGAENRPLPYCECLWRFGVRNLGRLVSDPQAQKIAARCKKKNLSP